MANFSQEDIDKTARAFEDAFSTAVAELRKRLGETVEDTAEDISIKFRKAFDQSVTGKLTSVLDKVYGSKLTDKLGKINGALKGSKTNLAELAIELGKAGLAADKQFTEMGKSMSMTKTEAMLARYELAGMAAFSGDVSLTTETLVKSTAALQKNLGVAKIFSKDVTVEFAQLTERMGLAEDAAAGLSKISIAMGKDAHVVTTEALGTAQALQSQAGIQLNNRQILEEVGKVSGQLLANFAANPSKIAAAVTQAKLLGTTLEQTKKQGAALLDFESSIAAELEAELITGEQINLERARGAALLGDQETLMKELSNQNLNFTKFSQMNVVAQKSIASALGLSADELSNQLMQQQFLNKSREEVIALSGEEVANRLEALNAQDRFNKSIEKLQSIFVSLIDGPIGILLDAVASTLSLFVGDTSGWKNVTAPFTTSNDLYSGYGERTLITPKGAYALNNKDTVIAGTNLFRGNDVFSGPAGALNLTQPEFDYDKLAQAMSKVQISSQVKLSELTTPITAYQQQNMRRSV